MNDDDGAGRKSQPGWSGRAHSEFTYGTITLGGAAVEPTLSIEKAEAGITITFTGTLQAADSVTGEYLDMLEATSPYAAPTTGSAKFYRARQ